MNCGTPVIVISSADILPESTLHMLGRNEIQEAIHRTSNTEKLETDLITALSHVIGQSASHLSGDAHVPMLPFPVQTAWSTTPHYTSAPMPPFQQTEATGLTPTVTPIRTSPTEMQGLNMMKALNSSQINAQMSDFGLRQLQDGLMEQAGTMKLFVSDPVTQVVNQGSASFKMSPPLGVSAQENPESVLPGIETLLNAIQVVEGEAPAGNNQAAMFTKFTALNSADSADARPASSRTKRRARRSSTGNPRSAKRTISDTELESLNDTKSPIAASLVGKKPYFLTLDSYKEAMADDPNVNAVDRHNSKERHRRIRITKAAEFFKAVIPGMDPNMDKATAFHLTVYYMVFLRNALRQQDPPIIPKLHETFKEEWGEIFSMDDPPEAD
ncbi:hypothetical protein OS493_026394 [Desmophyllum pertusum]|uniref:BHLH domain-containing protein n=1 Tax=Desmophyllum pertusum TaxID=174260 RepID=A0A9W9ZAB9_9CNID|nr:hypothetical protein OS493_026394 [Desmophyllum pertusum]